MPSEGTGLKRGPRILNDHFKLDLDEVLLWNISYSQTGEDLVVRGLLRNELKKGYVGFYADLGCFDPRLGSNSYLLYQYGWRGICVDVNPTLGPEYARVRPRDTFVLAAIGEEGVGYWAGMESAASSVVVRTKAEIPADAIVRLRLPFLPLKTLFERHMPADVTLDVLFMDIEGSELTALHSNDWSRYRPRIIVIEVNDMDAENVTASPTIAYLRNLSYKVVAAIFPNVILVSN